VNKTAADKYAQSRGGAVPVPVTATAVATYGASDMERNVGSSSGQYEMAVVHAAVASPSAPVKMEY